MSLDRGDDLYGREHMSLDILDGMFPSVFRLTSPP